MKRWYAVKVKSNCERVAHDRLDAQMFVCYVPRALAVDVVKGRRRERKVVLFPGYVFVKLDLEADPWEKVGNTRHVLHLLPFKHVDPWPLPIGMVERIREEMAAETTTLDRALDLVNGYVKGDAVPITNGLMCGQVGEFDKYEDGVVHLLVGLLGRQTMLQASPHDVEPRTR